MQLQIGQVLQNRYRIVNLLGQGGYGAVYRAWDINLNQPCALKENLRTDIGTQFETEAHILQGMKHINLPRVRDFFTIPGQGQYLVMDFVEGRDLQTVLEQTGGPLPLRDVLTWMGQIGDALNYLHNQNPPVIHRDINPKNIIINSQGSAVLVDFGIAKFHMQGSKTTQGARAVTPGYSPPEQYGYGSTDARSDIYSLGTTMYVLLTGNEYPESVHRMTNPQLEPPPARALNPQVPQTVSDAIQIATQIEQSQRFANVGEFIAALSAPSTRRITTTQPAKRAMPGWLVPVMIGLMVIMLLVGVGLGVALLGSSASAAQNVVVVTRVAAVTVIAPTNAPVQPPTNPTAAPPAQDPTAEPAAQLAPTSTAMPPQPTSAPEEGTCADGAVVNEPSANARLGPGKAYPVLAYLHKDNRFEPIGRNADGSWLALRLDDGRLAWLSVSVLEVSCPISGLAVLEAPEAPTLEPTWTPGPHGNSKYP